MIVHRDPCILSRWAGGRTCLFATRHRVSPVYAASVSNAPSRIIVSGELLLGHFLVVLSWSLSRRRPRTGRPGVSTGGSPVQAIPGPSVVRSVRRASLPASVAGVLLAGSLSNLDRAGRLSVGQTHQSPGEPLPGRLLKVIVLANDRRPCCTGSPWHSRSPRA
jgi:hypothetical protein